jgi:putative ABC transport system permease protein
MFGQSIIILVRRFTKDPVFSLATLSGLCIGFTAFIIMGQFINSMVNYNKSNTNYDRIYRVQIYMSQNENRISHSSSVTAALSRNDLPGLPEVERITLIHDVGDNNKDGIFLSPDRNIQLMTRWGFFADSTVFNIFTFHFLEGDPQNALTQPLTIVLSKTCADKLFKGEKALGKQVYLENKVGLTVTGVYEDVAAKSTWKPSFLLPMQSFAELMDWQDYETNYKAYSFAIYVLLKKNADPKQVDYKIHNALKEYNETHFPYLRPMANLYLNPYFEPDFYIAIGLISFNALLVLILSAINYINLQTANASTRFREIGIKKTVGFTKKQLWNQFIMESVILAFISGVIGLILSGTVTPLINDLIGSEVLDNLLSDWALIIAVVLISILTGLLSGIHPAYAISSFNPVTAMKQKYIEEKGYGINLRKILVTAQFSIAIFLLTVGFIIFRQTNYMVNRNMGFESHNLLFTNIITDKQGPITALREEMLRHPEIVDVCQSDYIPFILPGGSEISWDGAYPDQKVFVRYSQVGYDFVPTFDLKIAQGRNFSRDFPADHNKCLLNETAVKVFGWKDPIGKKIEIRRGTYTVIGVVKDYIVFSVHNPLEPHFYRLIPDTVKSNVIFSVRYKPGYEKQAMKIANDSFEKFFPDDAFEFQNIQNRIQNENAVKEWRHLMKINILFAILSILVSSIGLFGLILFYSRHKLKEIGIRKVLGFSSMNLYYTLSSGFIKLLFLSIVFAWPLAYYAYKSLPGANKYPIQIWEFLIATSIILIVALATISYQILKALKVKPVDILKDE